MLAVESQRLCFCFGEIELVWPHLALPARLFAGRSLFASEPALELVWRACARGREEREGGLKGGGLLELPIADLKSPLMISGPIRSEGVEGRILLSVAHIHRSRAWAKMPLCKGLRARYPELGILGGRAKSLKNATKKLARRCINDW